MRTIFSTVSAPHEPAFTVESLAISATSRPCTRAMPVTTPSAGRSPASALAKTPSSMNDPASTRSSMRLRANSLPVAVFASWYFGLPPFSAVARVERIFSVGWLMGGRYHGLWWDGRPARHGIPLFLRPARLRGFRTPYPPDDRWGSHDNGVDQLCHSTDNHSWTVI